MNALKSTHASQDSSSPGAPAVWQAIELESPRGRGNVGASVYRVTLAWPINAWEFEGATIRT
jgi:hypothetical protein